jgi:catechol 2,3-dioxygenase-like lactoylglutathione lyase family enzyme
MPIIVTLDIAHAQRVPSHVAGPTVFIAQTSRKKGRENHMGILASAKPDIVICTRDRARATAFYRETLGLVLAREDKYSAVFDIGGVNLRLSSVADFTAHEHTILGFNVSDVEATVKALREKGVTFNIYPNFKQNELGILTLPDTAVRVAWFKDPDGNVLSVTNA